MTFTRNREQPPPYKISLFAAFVLATVIFLAAISLLTAFPRPYDTDKTAADAFIRQTLSRWRAEYGPDNELKVGRVDIYFDSRPDRFESEEGAVIAPVGIDLENGQKILDIAAYPPIVRELRVDGIRCLAWPYPGKYRDDFHYTALCLVKQTGSGKVVFPDKATHDELSLSFASDALARATELEEHGLEECAAFHDWAVSIAGTGPYTDRFQRIVRKIAEDIIPEDEKRKGDDICAAVRHGRFKIHRAHVAAVMACRENNIPCFGFFGATPEKNHLVATFSDQSGWLYFDLDHPARGFFTDPPVLLTQAPLFTDSEAGVHGFWDPTAAACQESSYWGLSHFSYTKWGDEKTENASGFTMARTIPLETRE